MFWYSHLFKNFPQFVVIIYIYIYIYIFFFFFIFSTQESLVGSERRVAQLRCNQTMFVQIRS